MKKGGIAPRKAGQGQRHISPARTTPRSQLTQMKRQIMRRGLPPRAQRSMRNTAQRQQVQSRVFSGGVSRGLGRK